MQYFWLTVRHKWYVFRAGRKLKVPIWRLIKHDWTKFLPSELPHYQRQFFGAKDDPEGFIKCWTRHQNRHEHHWEYWIPRTGHNRCEPPYVDNEPIDMPEVVIREMVADWMGASKAYEGKYPWENDWKWDWFEKNFYTIRITRKGKDFIWQLLYEMGWESGANDGKHI